MKPGIKKVMAIHDLSGFGRASLTSIIPSLSSMGIQVCPVPTAILSTHSGGFTDYTFSDMTDIMLDYTNHWKQLGLEFECIYSGFLGSPKQAKIVEKIIDQFKTKDTLVVVDPVMGDDGELYQSVHEDMVEQMKQLISRADIITPNYTEANLFLDKPMHRPKDLQEMKENLLALAKMGSDIVIITSVPDNVSDKIIHTLAYDKVSNRFWKVSTMKQPSSYPGTGDLFTSVLVGSLLQGDSLPIAMDRSAQFISQCIKASQTYDYPTRNGVLLEQKLYLLKEPGLISEYEEF